MDETLATEIFKAWLLGLLTNVDQNDFIKMVRERDYPPIFDVELPQWLNGIIPIIKANKDKILPLLTIQKTVEIGKLYRPDLVEVINTVQGGRWMEIFLKQIHFLIENIELTPYERKEKLADTIAQRKAAIISEQSMTISEANQTIPNDKLAELNKEQT